MLVHKYMHLYMQIHVQLSPHIFIINTYVYIQLCMHKILRMQSYSQNYPRN